LARVEQRNDDAIQEYQLALANLPSSGVAEGILYPIQLRLALADQYRENGDESNAQQQVDLAAKAISQLDMQGPSRSEFLRLRASIKAAGEDFSGAESDLKEALNADPENINVVVQYAAMLWRMKRPAEARKLYQSALAKDPHNRFALESLGYLAREEGDNKTAEEFFNQLRDAYPNDFVAYVALGDLYTALRRFPEAQENYEKAYTFAASNAQIVAGGANAAIEAHKLDLAATWLDRAHGRMKDDARVMREEERFLFHKGKFLESAQLGRKVLEKLPGDREGSVYLAYDLYNLGRFDDALALSRKYQQILPKEPNFPLLAGHAEKQSQLLAEAVDDYTHVIEIDPTIDQAWINRGYVLNDLQNAEQASHDFQYVLKTEPNNGVAHLGLAFSYLELHQGKLALAEADKAQSLLGESGSTHLARASAFRQMRLLNDAEKEYRAALKYTPHDLTLQLALADTLYHLRRYAESIAALNDALALLPDDASIYGKLAHAYARLHDRDMTLRYVNAAEHEEPDASSVLLDTGDALLTLGDEHAAMDRFARALEAPDANRVDARLLIAKVMALQGHWAAARQQISLAFAESRIGEASPVTTDNLVEAANLFLRMHDFELAQKYFLAAKQAGAGDQVVAIGLANTYLAQGDAPQAEAQLRGLGDAANFANDYDYTLAMANLYRERRDNVQALNLFARANSLAGDEDIAGRAEEDLAGQEGYRINQKLSVFSDLKAGAIFDDSTLYTSYARLNQVNTAITPHSLLETRWIDGFHLHEGNLPLISGFFELRNARGSFSVPSQFKFVPQDTYDYMFNGGINPVLHLGRDYLAFNTSLAFTARRDLESPIALNQNLFRQQIYLQSSPFWNWISVQGTAMREAGPFTLQNLSSRDLVADLQFRVGRPWGKTALLTGYRVRDLLFHPRTQEWFQTASWVGVERKFGTKLTVGVKGEYVRSWAVLDSNFGAAQMLRPAFEIDYRPKRHWEANGSFAFSRGRNDHSYDNMQSGFFISYVKPLRRGVNDGAGEVPVDYPLRFSVGLQQQDFFNYTGVGQAQQFQPVFRLTIF
jgi:tetratricopeptide (TPR) repeat protein